MTEEQDHSHYAEALSDLLAAEKQRLESLQNAERNAKAFVSETESQISKQTEIYNELDKKIDTLDRTIMRLRSACGFAGESISEPEYSDTLTATDLEEIQRNVAALKKNADCLRSTIGGIFFGDQRFPSNFDITSTQQQLANAASDIQQASRELARLRSIGGFSAELFESDANSPDGRSPSLTTVTNTVRKVVQDTNRIEIKLPKILERREEEMEQERERMRVLREKYRRRLWIAGGALLAVVILGLLIYYNDTVRTIAMWTVLALSLVALIALGIWAESDDSKKR